MKYRKDRYGQDLSVLGYGCMRFSRKGGSLDLEKAEKEILAAWHAGVNYYDTAYIYPGSEAALGEILEKNQIREKVYIATKLPHYLIKKYEDLPENCRKYVEFIEEQIGYPITMVSNGPGRDDIIYRS